MLLVVQDGRCCPRRLNELEVPRYPTTGPGGFSWWVSWWGLNLDVRRLELGCLRRDKPPPPSAWSLNCRYHKYYTGNTGDLASNLLLQYFALTPHHALTTYPIKHVQYATVLTGIGVRCYCRMSISGTTPAPRAQIDTCPSLLIGTASFGNTSYQDH